MYVLVTHDEARGQLRELPDRVVTQYLGIRAALEISPWTAGRSSKPSNPNANIYTLDIADSDVTVWHAIAERDREVHILEVLWLRGQVLGRHGFGRPSIRVHLDVRVGAGFWSC